MLGRLTNDKDEKIKDGHQIFYDRHKEFWRCKFAPNQVGIFNAIIMAKKKSDPRFIHLLYHLKLKQNKFHHHLYLILIHGNSFMILDLKIEAPQDRSHAMYGLIMHLMLKFYTST